MAESKAHEIISPVEGGSPPTYPSPEGNPSSDSSISKIIQNAKAATQKEQNMSLLQGIKLYPKAVAWSILISTCIAMEGYDISLVNNFYGFPQFKRKYGEKLPNGKYEVTAPVWLCMNCSTLFVWTLGNETTTMMTMLTRIFSGKQV